MRERRNARRARDPAQQKTTINLAHVQSLHETRPTASILALVVPCYHPRRNPAIPDKPTTVAAYLASLPDDRRAAISAVRDVILKAKDKDIAEGIQYGMIGYFIPHSVFPAGYHCDPKVALPYIGMGNQKNGVSIYMHFLYAAGNADGDTELTRWFQDAWAKTGKKLDMGKACLRFKTIDDLALDVLAEAIRRVPSKKYIEHYTAVLDGQKSRKPAAKTATKTATKPAAKPAKKAAKKATSKVTKKSAK